MNCRAIVSLLVLLAMAGSLSAHDLFLKLDSYFVAQGAEVVVRVLNGTFSASESARTSTRTDSAGVARLRIGSRGAWYVKFIHMQRVAGDSMIDYESKWATLTFGVR